MNRETPRLIAVTPVRAGREAAFEAFVKDVVAPASDRIKPHLAGQWQLVRPAKNPPGDATAPAYLFLFYGDAPPEDWDLEEVLPAAYGADEGKQRMQEFVDMIAGEQTVYAIEPVE